MIYLEQGNCLDIMRDIPQGSINCVITSPPYWGLRDYGFENQLGSETNPVDYINNLCNIFDIVWNVLKDDGVLFVNIADSYFRNGGKNKGKNLKATVGNTRKGIQKGNCKVPDGFLEKSLVLIPQRFVLEMNRRGWICRNQIIWHKPNAMPQPLTDRFGNDYEIIFMFVKQKRYKFNLLKENLTGKERVKRAVWSINTKASKYGHVAPFPEKLIEPLVSSATNEGEIVLDCFMGSGTVGEVCKQLNRNFIGIEINPKYFEIAKNRLGGGEND